MTFKFPKFYAQREREQERESDDAMQLSCQTLY